jgi:hypothetical protein
MSDSKSQLQAAKLFFALIAQTEEQLAQVAQRLAKDFGTVDYRSEIFPFTQTDYYNEEMGENLLRLFVSSEALIEMDEISSIKAVTNRLERFFADPQTGKRRVNIDPGYLSESKVVLATMKDRDHRIYLGSGVFAEVTLVYKRKERGYTPLQWTYPDYREPTSLAFFNHMREIYRKQIHPEHP